MKTLREKLFTNLADGSSLDYESWFCENRIGEVLNIQSYREAVTNSKGAGSIYDTVAPNSKPLPLDLNDLIRLHFLVRNRRVTTILEFGIGRSTLVLADALQKNKVQFQDFVVRNLRRENAFQIHTVDNNVFWIDNLRKSLDIFPEGMVHLYLSETEMTTFNGRACTMYRTIPNVCPDLIYLDGPDQFSVNGDVRGISTRALDRVPMAADILVLEPFLSPGTLIVVDGRTANARFLRNNLQRSWEYCHFEVEDIHFFELVEPPLGEINKKHLDFCFGR